MEELGKESLRHLNGLATRCLAFLWHAYNNENGHFRNFMGYDRRWLEEKGSPDSHARALVGIGHGAGPVTAGRTAPGGGPIVRTDAADRARVYRSSVGFIYPYRIAHIFAPVSRRQGGARNSSDACRAIVRGISKNRFRRLELVRQSIDLCQRLAAACPFAFRPRDATKGDGSGWTGGFGMAYVAFKPRAKDILFPSATRDSILAAETAHASISSRSRRMPRFRHVSTPSTLTGQAWWKQEAIRTFEWFLGRNDVGAALYDPLTGGCCDGLSTEGPNANQGSESTLVFLLSLAELRLLEYIIPAGREKTSGNGQIPAPNRKKSQSSCPRLHHERIQGSFCKAVTIGQQCCFHIEF